MFAPEHISTWVEGLRLSKRLSPFQLLIFQWYSCLPPYKTERKSELERIVFDFRQKYLNPFLYELKRPTDEIERFLKRFTEFESLKKPNRKDFKALFEDLGAFPHEAWPGGVDTIWHGWRPKIVESAIVYPQWHLKDVEALRTKYNMNTKVCATCGAKYPWHGFLGPMCPANLKPYCCKTCPSVDQYLNECKPFALTNNEDAQHILDTYQMAIRDWATSSASVNDVLTEVYLQRVPDTAEWVEEKNALQNQCQSLTNELSKVQESAKHFEDMYRECNTSIQHMNVTLRKKEETLSQYRSALSERDAIIRRGTQQLRDSEYTLHATRCELAKVNDARNGLQRQVQRMTQPWISNSI